MRNELQERDEVARAIADLARGIGERYLVNTPTFETIYTQIAEDYTAATGVDVDPYQPGDVKIVDGVIDVRLRTRPEQVEITITKEPIPDA